MYKKEELESVFVEISQHEPNLIIGCIYKHPNIPINEFNVYYKKLLAKILHERKRVVFLGDFNIDLLNSNSNDDIEHFLTSNLSSSITPLITRPSHITPKSKIPPLVILYPPSLTI